MRTEPELVRLGSHYGGWWVPKKSLSHELESKVCISAGIGGDVTFDKALLEAGFQVIALDPLEQCIVFANESLAKFREFTALQMGLWNQSGTQTFFSPQNLDHDSWSATNSQNTSISSSKDFKVTTPQSLIEDFPEVERAAYTILKMDIEGAELAVIPALCDLDHTFNWLAIEFDHLALIPFFALFKRARMILKARLLLRSLSFKGYTVRHFEGFNVFFLGEIS